MSLYPVTAATYAEYHVVVSNPGGSTPSETATISPPPAPTIIQDPSPVYALVGQQVTFSVQVFYSSAPYNGWRTTYEWRRNGEPIPDSNTYNLTLNVGEASFGDYDVVVSNAGGLATSKTAALIRAVPATITTSPVSARVFPGGDALFEVVASGAPATFSYRWQRYSPVTRSWVNLHDDTYNFAGVETASLMVTNATFGMNGLEVRCVASNGFAPETVSASAILTVDVNAGSGLRFTLQPLGRTVTSGTAVAFAVATNALTPPVLQWFHNGVLIPDAHDPILIIPSATSADVGNYTVLAQDGHVAVMSLPAALVVSDAPRGPALRPVASVVTAILGEPCVLTVRVGGLPAPTLVWRKGTAVLAMIDGPVFTLESVTLADAGTYRVTATNAAGSASVDIRLAIRPPAPAAPNLDNLRQGSLVGQELSFGFAVPGLRYRATGLPTGLRLDPATGRLAGVVKSHPGTYALSLWTEVAGAKSDVVHASATVGSFPSSLVGTYESNQWGNSDSAGLLRITVSATGAFTGVLQRSEVAKPLAMSGILNPATDGLYATVTVALPAGRSLWLAFYEIDEYGRAEFRGELIEAGWVTGIFNGQPLLVPGSVAVPWAGAYTLSLAPPTLISESNNGSSSGPIGSSVSVLGSGVDNSSFFSFWEGSSVSSSGTLTVAAASRSVARSAEETALPEGYGYATATIATNGRLTLTGKLADGRPITATLSPDLFNGYRWFSRPYAAGDNFFAGGFVLNATDEEPARYQVTENDQQTLVWKKSPQAGDKAYPGGFDPCNVTLSMQPWVPPTATVKLATRFGFTETPAGLSAQIDLSSATDSQLAWLPPGFVLNAGNKITTAADTPGFSAKSWRFVPNFKTGRFTASLFLANTVSEDGLRATGRTVAIEGVMLQDVDVPIRGFFLLPDASTPATIHSGGFLLTR